MEYIRMNDTYRNLRAHDLGSDHYLQRRVR